MIQATSLRIGNWIDIDGKRQRVLVISNELISGDKAALCEPDEVHPIPLTPEILEKAGFGHSDVGGNFYTLNSVVIGMLKDGDFYYSYEDQTRWIKYVHELQNLYFALTGTELKIEL